MHRKVEALRPLLRATVLAALVLAGADLLLLALRHWPGWSLPTLFDDGYFSAAISVVLLAIVLVLARRLARALDRAESAARLQQQVLDALEAGLVLFDANGRIVFCNRHFLRLYANLGAAASPGATYEQLLRAVVANGMAPDATGQEEAWIARRLTDFGRTDTGLMRRMPDGSWRRIAELRLPDGGVLAHIVDVSEMVAKEEAIEAARRDAEQARERLAGGDRGAARRLRAVRRRRSAGDGQSHERADVSAAGRPGRPAADIRASGANQRRPRRPAVSEDARAAGRLDRTQTERAQESVRGGSAPDQPRAAGFASTSGACATADWWPFASTSAS